MTSIGILSSLPSFSSPTVISDKHLLAYWWKTDNETTLRLYNYKTTETETVDLETEGYSPGGWEPMFWRNDQFLVQSRPNVFLLDLEGTIEELPLEEGYTHVFDIDSTGRRYLYHYAGEHEESWTLRLYDCETDTKTILTEHPEQMGHAGFSPDDQLIAYRENPTESFDADQLVVVDLDGTRKRIFHTGDSASKTRLYRWHPDGQRLLLDDRSDGWYRVGLHDWQTDETTWYGSGEYNEHPLGILPDGEQIVTLRFSDGHSIPLVYAVNDDGAGTKLGLEEGVVEKPTLLGNYHGPGSSLAPQTILLKHETATRPPRLLGYDLETDDVIPIADTQTDELAELNLVEADHITYESTDGLSVNAVLYRATDSCSPAVVLVHGGPTEAVYHEFDPFAQFLVSNGYTVLQPNYRGSTDQDQAFEEAIRGESGDRAVDDVAEGARWLAEQDWVDSDQLAVFGHSAGAYNAAMQAIRHPDLWQVVIPENGFLNRVESLRDPNQYALRRIIKDPDVETREEYLRERSPVHRTDDIECPVCIIHGENDPGLEASKDFVEGVKERGWTEGKEYRFEVIENEGHIINDTDRLWSLVIEVLDEYVPDGPHLD